MVMTFSSFAMVVVSVNIILYSIFGNAWVFLLFLVLLNALLAVHYGKIAIKHLLFPFGQNLVKHNYHRQMNEKMANELKSTLGKVKEIIDQMNINSHTPQITSQHLKERPH
jgi:uncharacterized membrane protein